ncbi:hypothetical protein ACWGI8_22895 [Streptomyces sp. NPDC054841]
MCSHAEHGHRFDPGLCEGYCPVCGAGVGAELGQPVAAHQRAGSLEMCPGAGAPAV